MSEQELEDEPQPEDRQAEPESEDEELPENVPDDWLEQKPFDPAGR